MTKGRHGTPFEHGFLSFTIETPIVVAREHMRHRIGWSYNEMSGRYSRLKPRFYIPPKTRPIVEPNGFRPMKPKLVPDRRVAMKQAVRMRENSRRCWTSYIDALDDGVAREVARMDLPLNLMTRYRATCNPRSLMAFLSLRVYDKDAMFPSFAMYEIERVATIMERMFREHFPITYQAFTTNGRVSP